MLGPVLDLQRREWPEILMIYYRIALRGSQSATWWRESCLFTSLDRVLGLLKLYHCMPKERIRVFLSSSTEQMDAMLSLANQGLLSTAVPVDQLWNKHRTSWIEVRRLEVELGSGGDHDYPYTLSLPPRDRKCSPGRSCEPCESVVSSSRRRFLSSFLDWERAR